MAILPRLLTVSELAHLAAHLEGRRCSPRQVRYLLLDGRLGTDVQPRTRGQTRLFGVIDVALVRLALRLAKEGLSPAAARVVLTYLRTDLIRAWQAGGPVALAVRGIQGSLEPALKSRPAWAIAWVPLREIWHGLDRQVQHARESRETVWMWRNVSVRAVRST